MIQDKGRELEVPPLTLQALRELANIYRDDIMFTPAFVPAMQAVLVSTWLPCCRQHAAWCAQRTSFSCVPA